ncbi:unnamed protein product [Parnassius apollo]|uniref:(apollo) hypothetical protein n=1 Tax=Parnassius apollo TaxID=110799 RepID=A0A8S3XDQ4_PARAO|nr:unnamed protein product [Parnassius apollo]
MTEKQIGFLFKASTVLAPVARNNVHTQILRSYYLMRCKEITRGYGLPQQQFSNKNRCSYCCLEWTKHTETKVRPLKLSKRQKRRIKQKKDNVNLLQSNKLEYICTFCKHCNEAPVLKLKKERNIIKQQTTSMATQYKPLKNKPVVTKTLQSGQINSMQLNIYSKTKEVFSLSNKNNNLFNTIRNEPKVIKNSKKRKDKFAGLCKKAVLASAKLKKDKEEPNKLSLFLKPSL